MKDYGEYEALFKSKEWKRFEKEAEKTGAMIASSALTLQINPGDLDAKVALELGFTILLDKPLIVIATPDRPVPPMLRRVADRVIEVESVADSHDAIYKALADVMEERMKKDDAL